MIVMSLDLSFTSTGVCIIDYNNKDIFTKPIKIGCKDKSFLGIQKSIYLIVKELDELIKKYKIDSIIMEEPFCGACFSAGLYGLDSAVYQKLKNKIIKTFHPSTLRKIHKKKYKKSDSINLANLLLNKLLLDGYNININNYKNKITSDESEALIYNIYYHKPELF